MPFYRRLPQEAVTPLQAGGRLLLTSRKIRMYMHNMRRIVPEMVAAAAEAEMVTAEAVLSVGIMLLISYIR